MCSFDSTQLIQIHIYDIGLNAFNSKSLQMETVQKTVYALSFFVEIITHFAYVSSFKSAGYIKGYKPVAKQKIQLLKTQLLCFVWHLKLLYSFAIRRSNKKQVESKEEIFFIIYPHLGKGYRD
jgi:hypothetical protein